MAKTTKLNIFKLYFFIQESIKDLIHENYDFHELRQPMFFDKKTWEDKLNSYSRKINFDMLNSNQIGTLFNE